jgi:hypothetical protein
MNFVAQTTTSSAAVLNGADTHLHSAFLRMGAQQGGGDNCRLPPFPIASMQSGDVLVDDWPKYRHLWEAAGSIFILHENADKSIEQVLNLFKTAA